MRLCRLCKKRKAYRHRTVCSPCHAKQTYPSKNKWSKSAEGKEYNRWYRIKREFGITKEQYEELLEEQDGRCAICHRHHSEFKQALHVDHDHATGEIRGLLCNYDNRIFIGRHRDADRYDKAAQYLRKERRGWIVPKKKKRRRKRKT